jgi:hypothetical protein
MKDVRIVRRLSTVRAVTESLHLPQVSVPFGLELDLF